MAINNINGNCHLHVHGGSQRGRADPIETERAQSGPGPSGAAQGSDEVRLTRESFRLRQLETALGSEPVVDTPRVEALRTAIDRGEYQVNPARVAGRLLGLEAELFK